MLCLGNDVQEESFVSGEQSRDYDKANRKWLLEGSEGDAIQRSGISAMKSARSIVWKHMKGIEMKAGKFDVRSPSVIYFIDKNKENCKATNLMMDFN